MGCPSCSYATVASAICAPGRSATVSMSRRCSAEKSVMTATLRGRPPPRAGWRRTASGRGSGLLRVLAEAVALAAAVDAVRHQVGLTRRVPAVHEVVVEREAAARGVGQATRVAVLQRVR